jgi:hypothetical protein
LINDRQLKPCGALVEDFMWIVELWTISLSDIDMLREHGLDASPLREFLLDQLAWEIQV